MPKIITAILLFLMAFSFVAENVVMHKNIHEQAQLQKEAGEGKEVEKEKEKEKYYSVSFNDLGLYPDRSIPRLSFYEFDIMEGFHSKPYTPPKC